MIKKIKKNQIIPIILQILKKQKLILNMYQQINTITIKLLEFLWLHKLIFGFTTKRNLRLTTVYLKYNLLNNNLSITKPKLFCQMKNLRKKQNWSKNSFFILVTTKGILTVKQAIAYNIGGFVLYKLF